MSGEARKEMRKGDEAGGGRRTNTRRRNTRLLTVFGIYLAKQKIDDELMLCTQ